MNYGKQNLRELLAGEYVLGLLRGAARRRFERLLIEDARLRAEVTAWEEKFAVWNSALQPVTPPNSVWRKLDARVTAEMRARKKTPGPRVFKGLWSGAAALAVAALLVIGIFLGRSVLAPAPAPGYLALMSTAKGQPRWLITVNPQTRRVHMQALADNTPPVGKSYQLWMLPGSGKPISLGLMNSTGTASETLTPEMIVALAHAKGLAISIEPAGGSPTGQPTGPVVYMAPIVNT